MLNTINPRWFQFPVLLCLVVLLAVSCAKKKGDDVGDGNFPTSEMMEAGETGETLDDKEAAVVGEESPDTSEDQMAMTRMLEMGEEDLGTPEKLGGEMLAVGEPIPELPNVYFALDSEELTPATRTQLDKNAAYLSSNPDLNVVLRGHTDDSGTEEYNMALGSRRASAVRDYLVDRGVAGNRMQTVSYGEAVPISAGNDEASRSQNRRVEFFAYTLSSQ